MNWALVRHALEDQRARMAGSAVSLEPTFLPAALEVADRPVSPTARITAWVLLAGLAITLLWLVLGRVDVVATVEGKVAPSDSVKLVQAADSGVVRHIHVHDGDVVRRGQPLIDLDPTASGADETQARKLLLAAELDVARNRALLDGLSGGSGAFQPPEGTPPDIVATQRQLVAAQLAGFSAESAEFQAARRSAESDMRAASDQVRTFDATGPMLDRQLAAVKRLAAKGYAPGFRLIELQRQRRSEAGSRDVAAAQVARGRSEAIRFAEQVAQSRERARQTALTELSRAQNDLILRREELTKAQQRSRMQRLVAPVDGTVQQLAVHTVGGVAEAVRPLMVIVPDGALIAEARVLNRDAGFVRTGQRVAVKLEAFPFTRYGSIGGRIVTIGRDAVQDEKTPSYYPVRIALDRHSIMADGKTIALSPGLAVTGDVQIGSRPIISYLLDPLQSSISSAGRER